MSDRPDLELNGAIPHLKKPSYPLIVMWLVLSALAGMAAAKFGLSWGAVGFAFLCLLWLLCAGWLLLRAVEYEGVRYA